MSKLLKSAALAVGFSVMLAGAAHAAGPCCKDGAPCCEKKDGKVAPCCEEKAAPKPGDTKPAPHEHQH